MEKLLSDTGEFSAIGRGGYNRLLDLLDQLFAEDDSDPAIIVANIGSKLAGYPPELVAHFRPEPARGWIDLGKLEIVGELWRQNKLPVIAALYCISLPSWYLLKNGIPALYETDKLTDPAYIYQRIYETGRFLDAVMSPGGLMILTRPWRPEETVETQEEATQPESYLWGRGFVSARKVRFLHSAMRYLLTHRNGVSSPGETEPQSAEPATNERPWDTARLGQPVNQEDLVVSQT